MNSERSTRISKFLSLVLRHQPETAHVQLDKAGWVEVQALLAGCAKARRPISKSDLEHVVETNAKKRFEFSADGRNIRASQGHSVAVELDYTPQEPPEMLYHGTATRFLDSIHAHGLRRMQRHHVHLSAETQVTLQVGARHGKPVLLTIQAGAMHRAGHVFYRSTNGVWLVERVPAEFILFPASPAG
ncbi:MAG: phosphotransferase KptA/Tpt1 [Verrucomicrobiales bacterium]|nr:phosphotransferase KptA/Tpt1 [Verrucomicrobiales bacterium]